MYMGKTCALIVGAAVALGTATPAQAVAKKPAAAGLAYVGESEQGLSVSLLLTKDRRKVKRFEIDWLALPTQCTSGLPYISMTTFGAGSTPALTIRSKRFRHTFADDFKVPGVIDLQEVPIVRGTVGLKRAFGVFRATAVVRNEAGTEINRCDTGSIPWTAKQ
jgi:hypothetical protein